MISVEKLATEYNNLVNEALIASNNKDHRKAIFILIKINNKFQFWDIYELSFKTNIFEFLANEYFYLGDINNAKKVLLKLTVSNLIDGPSLTDIAVKKYYGYHIFNNNNKPSINKNIDKPLNNLYKIIYNSSEHQFFQDNYNLLDNTKNERPDWREYWPIRNFLLNNIIDNDEYYGFLSPKFNDKTKLSELEVRSFLNDNIGKYDVISFSPFYDQSCLYINSFYQCESKHPNSIECMRKFLEISNYDVNLLEEVVPASSTIFCNYFIAKGLVWKKYLSIAEFIYEKSELNHCNLGVLLNSNTNYKNELLPLKIFIIERLINLIIRLFNLSHIQYPMLTLPLSGPHINNINDIILADIHKEIYTKTNFKKHLNIYKELSNRLNILGLSY